LKKVEKPLLCANWKENKDFKEAENWIAVVGEKVFQAKKPIIACVPFPFIFSLYEKISQKGWQDFVYLSAQDVSHFKEGAHTGEVAAEMLLPACKFCLIGHSERRKYFGETDQDVLEKLKDLCEVKITPILCLANISQLEFYLKSIPQLGDSEVILVYEPPDAISGGGDYHPKGPQTVDFEISQIKEKIGSKLVLYGGSVNPENIAQFLEKSNVDGALIGQASLDPQSFLTLFQKACML
jgi:triosephosphate isomerase